MPQLSRPAVPFVAPTRALVLAAFAAFAAFTLLVGRPPAAEAQGRPGAANDSFVIIHGTVLDSIHGTVLAGALVRVDSSHREAFTDSAGQFRIDSVPPGSHRVIVLHPVLDTLGISLVSPTETYAAGEVLELTLSIPSPETLAALLCAPAWRARGPAALVGFVRDPDTDGPAKDAKVSLLWYESDPLGLKKTPRVREATPGPDGHYRICGLPSTLSGKVQVFRGTVSSGEVPVELAESVLAMRSLSVASASNVQIAAGKPDSAGRPSARVVRGQAKVTGRVVNKAGQPVAGARVDVQGVAAATITRANGEFTLDSLPSGTQTIEVRKIGYSATEKPVELSMASPQQVTIRMSDYVPTLETVRVEAKRDKNLFDVGFTQREKMGTGYYLTGDRLNKNAIRLTDALRTVPGIHIVPTGDGQNVIQSSRDPNGGCVSIFVDGSPWQQQTPGDIDSFIRADELGAIEAYSPSSVPAQFMTAGQSSCETLVIWTQRRLNRIK